MFHEQLPEPLLDPSFALERNGMQAPEKPTPTEMPLQLLLFVDKRPTSRERIRQVRDCLNELRAEYPFELQVVDVGEQPYLAEHFRLVATPALIKIHPEPRHTLAGSNLVAQLQHWWTQWQRSVEEYLAEASAANREVEPPEVRLLPERLPLKSEVRSEALLRAAESPLAEFATNAIGQVSRPTFTPESIRSIARSAELIQLSDEVFRLKREKEELEHQIKFKDQIISMLAHDLRNPLTAASLALETLEMGHSSTEGWSSRLTPALTAQLLKHARTQTRSIDRMITDILQAARGASSELNIYPHKLEIGQLCRDALDSLRNRFAEKSQQVRTDIPSDLPFVLADADRIRQVVINLLDNASKYTPVGGAIDLSILHRTSQKIQVSVCDNGPGIPEENCERIFEDQYRLKRDEAQEGYGIGLSLCQRIIRLHYGRIWVDSVPNQGSCFHFTLPVLRV
jgi:two-component system clock-associated histidine kinase SasA